MSDLLTRYAGNKVAEVPPTELRILITEFLDSANIIMGTSAEKSMLAGLIGFAYDIIANRFAYMPMNHVKAAFEFGSLGQRGGTTKLSGRNIFIWLNEQLNIYQEQLLRQRKKEEDIKRTIDMSGKNKADGFVAAAVRMKVHWKCDGKINSEQYDSFSSKAIYDLLKAGVAEKDIRPRDVVPNYDETKTR